MKSLMLAALLSVTPVASVSAAALSNDALYDIYAHGHYEEAMRAGEAAHTAYGYAIAARAALADAVLRDSPCFDCLKRGEDYARQAVAADPGLADGQVWLAAALGYETRITGLVAARLHDTPGQAKAALDMAVKDNPKDPFAVSALGGWHIEVVRGGGNFLARHLYGASLEDAVALFDRAAKLAPGNVAVRYQIALALAGFDPDAYRARITSELDASLHGTAQSAYERAIQGRAAELKTALNGDRIQFDAKVRKFQGYP